MTQRFYLNKGAGGRRSSDDVPSRRLPTSVLALLRTIVEVSTMDHDKDVSRNVLFVILVHLSYVPEFLSLRN